MIMDINSTEQSEILTFPVTVNEETKRDEFTFKQCGICGDSHSYLECSIISIRNKVLDKPIPSRARLSLPDVLQLKSLADGSHSVYTRTSLAVGTEFGPFIAIKSLTLKPEVIYPIKTFLNNEVDFSEYYLDTTNENECCWMMFVKPASTIEEQNLICYQQNENIYFAALRDIQPQEELLVWYSSYLASKMKTHVLSSKDTIPDVVNNNSTEHLDHLVEKQQNVIPRALWNCKFCHKLEESVTNFARHLLTHYTSKWECQLCPNSYRYVEDYRKHLKIAHPNSLTTPKSVKFQKTMRRNDKTTSLLPIEAKKNNLGGPLLLQDLNENSDSIEFPQPHQEITKLFDGEALLDGDNLFPSVEDLITFKGIEEVNTAELKTNDNEEDFLCDICLKKFASPLRIRNHLKMHMGTYYCYECKRIFSRRENLKFHKCNQTYSLECPKCPKLFSQLKFLNKHLVYHERKFVCHKCHKPFPSQSALNRHTCEKSLKKKTKKIKCPKCPSIFHKEEGLRNHSKKHITDSDFSLKYVCAECGDIFTLRDSYLRHIKCVHNQVKRFDCKICDKRFSRKDMLKAHLLVHGIGNKQESSCPHCQKIFKLEKNLKQHINLIHTIRDAVSCEQCGESFKYQKNLKRHIKKVHDVDKGSTGVECPVCQKKMKLESSITRHVKKTHPEEYRNVHIKISGKNDETIFCPVCHKPFKRDQYMYRHVLRKHPDYKVDENQLITDKERKDLETNDEIDEYMDLQKTLENLDFNIENENLFTGSDTVDKLLKESSDQISILCVDSPVASSSVVTSDPSITILTDRITNREIGLSMPDLSELDLEVKIGKSAPTSFSNLFESPDVVLYVVNEKGNNPN